MGRDHPGEGRGGRTGFLDSSRREPTRCAPTPLRYDPADPTPSVGGPTLHGGGPKDSRPLLGRPDTAAFAGPELDEGLEAVGEAVAEVHVRTALPHADVFVRVCDIGPRGAWTHVCDGIVRLEDTGSGTGPGAERLARVHLWPLAHRFERGHRIGVLITGGAHPRYERNLGTGDQLGTAVRANDMAILHDPQHASALLLPLRTGA